jgi:sulfur-oxidizing protein SoxY
MTCFHRRIFVKGSIAAVIAVISAALGQWLPRPIRAAEWPRDAYGAATVGDALRNLYGTSDATVAEAVKIRAPLRVESGAVVPIVASADLPDVQAISILVERNTPPLAAHLNLNDGSAYFSVNVRMAATSDVHVVVSSGGRLYAARQNIVVAIGA